jgi:hypothetical protein
MWFPLSKSACIVLTHDKEGQNKYFELLSKGRRKEAEAGRRLLPPIRERDARQPLVDGINHQTITNADRFVFSPFESADIVTKLQGECQNMRIVFSPPPSIRDRRDGTD